MKVFNSVNEYLNHAKVGDRIVLGGKGIIDGTKNVEFVWETKKVTDASKDKFRFKEFGGRKTYGILPEFYDQQIGVITDKEFKLLRR